jgi:hypothetical protein
MTMPTHSRQWARPATQELQAGVDEHGSVVAYAKALDIPRSTVQEWCRDAGVKKGRTRAPKPAKPALGSQVSREEILEQELADSRRALASLRKEDVREQRVIDAITMNLAAKESLYRPYGRKPSGRGAEHEFVLLWSDAHAGEVVSAEETNGMGGYDWEIMLARHQQILRSVLSYKAHRNYPVGKLHILGLGDGLSGNIHEELRETNAMPLEEATVQFGLDMADWIEEFVPEFAEITVSGVVGNHPRTTQKPAAKRKYNNSDWTAYQIMRQRLRRVKSVTFDIPKAQTHPVIVMGRRILMFHGDTVQSSSMVGVPTGGIVRHVAKLRNQWALAGMPLDHTVCGHFHEVNVYGGKGSFINGSIKGPDEYGLAKYGLAQPPMQLLLTFNERHGLTDVSYLDCGATA